MVMANTMLFRKEDNEAFADALKDFTVALTRGQDHKQASGGANTMACDYATPPPVVP